MESHRTTNLLEDARFLLECGEHIDRVAQRLGIKRDALEKLMERHA
jgi:hypothetical protein